MPFKISVYVPCYNVERTIARCLASLIAQRRRPDEILVIDDGSTDRTVQIAKRFRGVKIISHEKNMGLAVARNTGVTYGKGDLIGSIDADCVADPLWLEILEREMERDPGLHGIAGALWEAETDGVANRWRTLHMAQHYGHEPKDNPRFLFGANTLFRREVIARAGGYPSALRTNGEDFEICRGIYKNVENASLRYIPSAFVHHQRRDDMRSLANTYWRYQTYPSWMSPGLRPLKSTIRQTSRLLRQIWRVELRKDLRRKRYEGIWVALYLTVVMLRLQIREHIAKNRRERRA